MQLSNATVRLGGSLLHTVHKTDVTPAEILILQHIHGSDAVIDIRPTRVDKKRRMDQEWDRLATTYDRSSSLQAPEDGGEKGPLLQRLFPGAMRKLPLTLKEIGLGHLLSPASIAAAEAATAAEVDDDVPDADGADEADADTGSADGSAPGNLLAGTEA